MKRIGIGLLSTLLTAGLVWGVAKKRASPKKQAPPRISTAKRTAPPRITAKRAALPRISAAKRAAARAEIAEKLAANGAVIENSEALDPFYRVPPYSQVHILQFGDSHTASDDWVAAMRNIVKAKFGDGGPGFVHAGRPFKGYRRFDASATTSPGWTTQGTMASRGDADQGLSGLSISTGLPNRSVGLTADGDVLTLFYLNQPGGGRLELSDTFTDLGPIATDGTGGLGTSTFTFQPGQRILLLRTLDRAPVRLFGWSLDSRIGATFETLGINGAQANVMLRWNETMWAAAVAARNPALVILAYGTNEANSRLWTADAYRSDMLAVIARVRRAAPQAAILMIGPPDCGLPKPLLHLSDVVDAQREIAREQRVAFFDLRQFMGGARSVNLWYTAGYGQADRIHLTGEGYRLIGEAIAHAILEGKHEQAGLEQTGFEHTTPDH